MHECNLIGQYPLWVVVDQEKKGNKKDQYKLYLAKQTGHSKWGAEERDISRCTGIATSQNIDILFVEIRIQLWRK